MYNEVMKKVEGTPLIYELLVYLAEQGPQIFFNCVVLPKALLAVSVNTLGHTPRRNDLISQMEMERIAKALHLLLTVSYSNSLLPFIDLFSPRSCLPNIELLLK